MNLRDPTMGWWRSVIRRLLCRHEWEVIGWKDEQPVFRCRQCGLDWRG